MRCCPFCYVKFPASARARRDFQNHLVLEHFNFNPLTLFARVDGSKKIMSTARDPGQTQIVLQKDIAREVRKLMSVDFRQVTLSYLSLYCRKKCHVRFVCPLCNYDGKNCFYTIRKHLLEHHVCFEAVPEIRVRRFAIF